MHIDQIVAGATPGDAVTESALLVRDALRRSVDSHVYAYHLDARLGDHVGWTGHYPIARDRRRHDIILYHVSISQEGLNDFVVRRQETLVLVYHNITPAAYFTDIDLRFSEYLEEARRDLPRLLGRASSVIADSHFNAAELRALGRDDVHVVPPPMNLDRLLHVPPDPRMSAALERRAADDVILFVGQLLPHKRPDLLLAAFDLLVSNSGRDALLVLAGTSRNARFRHAVQTFRREMALENVWITGELTDAQLSALYRHADLFVTPSEHEGFCVPLVEAFAFDVPVIARDHGAVAETAADAALVLPSDSGARELAEAMRRVLDDAELRHAMIERGRVRRQVFGLDRTLPAMLEVLLDTMTVGRRTRG
jgi:glycosyltransferase involved in cell wall biosynthesis